MLEKVLHDYDLSKYTFTRKVIIEERAMNHAFPELTLNVRFADSEDELLSSFVHEQLHWYLRDHDGPQHHAVQELTRDVSQRAGRSAGGCRKRVQHLRPSG